MGRLDVNSRETKPCASVILKDVDFGNLQPALGERFVDLSCGNVVGKAAELDTDAGDILQDVIVQINRAIAVSGSCPVTSRTMSIPVVVVAE